MRKSLRSWMVMLAAFCNMLHANPVTALSMNYLYEGNHFSEVEGVTGLFSLSDHVTARFTLDCAVAHSEGNCRNLPYDDYSLLGAIDDESINFSAGPVVLPTIEGNAEIRVFSFSTDDSARILDWDMDLFLSVPWLNVDTDNVNGGTDSAGASGEAASVSGRPGVWGNTLSDAEVDFDIEVTKTVDNPSPLGPQRTVEFKVSVVNKGPGNAANVVVIDKLPAGLLIPEGMAAHTTSGYYDEETGRWEIGDLNDSLPEVMTLPAIVNSELESGCIVNTASLDVQNDIVSDNNSSSAAVRSPDLKSCVDLLVEDLRLERLSLSCQENFWLRFDIRIINRGPETAYNVVLNIEETIFEAPGLAIDHANCNGMRCTWSELLPGITQTVSGQSVRFNIDEPVDWAVVASLSSASGEYDSESNRDIAQLKIIPLERPASCDSKPADRSWNWNFSGCFIATASYGSEHHPSVIVLREFRDNVLMKSKWGREVIDFYYRHSPAIACYISERESMRTVTRWLLTPVVFTITHPWLALVLGVSLAILLIALLRLLNKKAV